MRVLHVVPSLAARRGGPTVAVLGACRHLRDLGVEVELLATRADLADDEEERLRADLDGLRLTLVDSLPGRLELSPSLLPALWSALGRVDVVHTHTVFTFPVAVVPALALARGIPLVMRPAGTLDRACLADGPVRQKSWAVRAWVQPALRRADCVQATSTAEAEELALLVDRGRIRVIPHGVEMPTQSAPPTGRFRVGSVGRLDPIKRVELVLEAAALVPGIELVLAGDGEPAYVASLKAHAARLGIAPLWLGHLDRHATATMLASCHALLFASSTESFGIAVAEAAAAGRAIVTTRAVAIADMLDAAGAAIVTAPNPAAFAEALVRLQSRALQEALGARARLFAESHWSWQSVAGELLALYQEISARRHLGLGSILRKP